MSWNFGYVFLCSLIPSLVPPCNFVDPWLWKLADLQLLEQKYFRVSLWKALINLKEKGVIQDDSSTALLTSWFLGLFSFCYRQYFTSVESMFLKNQNINELLLILYFHVNKIARWKKIIVYLFVSFIHYFS